MTLFRIVDAALIKGRGVVLFGDVIAGELRDGMSFESPFKQGHNICIQGIEVATCIDDGVMSTRFGLVVSNDQEADLQRWRDLAQFKIDIQLIE